MAEKSEVVAALMRSTPFRNRVRGVCANKAATILAQATPDADELSWAKGAVSANYDAWVEALLLLVEVQPATINAAVTAPDTAYATALNATFAQIVAAKKTETTTEPTP